MQPPAPAPARRPAVLEPGAVRSPAAAVSAAALALFLLVLLLVSARWSPLLRLDDGVRDRLNSIVSASPALVDVLRLVSGLGTSLAYSVALLVLAVVLVRRRRAREAAWAVATVLGGPLLNAAVKAAVHRARPVLLHPVVHAAYSSFPSGHAQGVVVATGVLLLVLRPRRRAPALVAAGAWVLLMGAARVGLGVHFLSDVVAGYLLGLSWLALSVAVVAAATGRGPRRGAGVRTGVRTS